MTDLRTIEVDQFLAHPPERVWRALTDPVLLGRWLMPNDFEPRVGHHFHFDAGPFGQPECEVLAIEEGRLLRISWRNGSLDSTVTWRLVPEGAGTRLLLEHSGFDVEDGFQAAAFGAMGGGWGGGLAQALADLLDSLDLGDLGGGAAWHGA
jgi:uncharacterized protein YndB with AHSA1/START domain